MAFNPFGLFRIQKKSTKVIMAILAIMCMFLFVIGDAIIGRTNSGDGRRKSWYQRWFGGVEDQIAVVDGRPLDTERLGELFDQRRLARVFIEMVQKHGQIALFREAGLTEEQARLLAFPESFANNPATMAKFMQLYQNQEINQKIRKLAAENRGFALSVEALNTNPSLTEAEGMVEFAVWRNKAEDLGIVVTDALVRDDLQRVATGRISEDEMETLAHRLGTGLDKILGWQADELRVLLARGAILGSGRFGQGAVGQATPADLWNAYVNIKTRLDVAILPVAVDRKIFLDQVPEPNESELKEYFTKYKGQEPNPASETPGFKIPKLFQIEFVHADLKRNDYYRHWSKLIENLDPAAAFARVVDFYEFRKSERYLSTQPFTIVPGKAEPAGTAYYRVPPTLGAGLWTTMAGVEQQTAMHDLLSLGAVAAQAPLAALGQLTTLSPVAEKLPAKEALSLEAAALVGNAVAGLPGLASFPPRFGYTEKFQPLEKVFGAIADELNEELRRRLLEADLAALSKDIQAYGKTYTAALYKWEAARRRSKSGAGVFVAPPFGEKKEPIAAYVKRFADVRGLTYEGMAESRARDQIFKEQGKTPLGTILRPLFRDLEEEEKRKRRDFSLLDEKRFNESVLTALTANQVKVFDPRRVKAPSLAFMPDDQLPPNEKQMVFALYWKSAEAKERVPDFAEAEPKVRQAWKLEKARDFARKHADDLAEKTKANKADALAAFKGIEGLQDDKTIARFELISPVTGTEPVNYKKADIPVIEHPPGDVIDEALNKLKAKGDVLVVANQPKTHYYVIALKNREEPKADDPVWIKRFDQEVILPDLTHQLQIDRTPLKNHVANERSQEFMSNWEKQLREKTKFDEEKAKQFAEWVLQRRDR